MSTALASRYLSSEVHRRGGICLGALASRYLSALASRHLSSEMCMFVCAREYSYTGDFAIGLDLQVVHKFIPLSVTLASA